MARWNTRKVADPSDLGAEKIGAYAKREIYSALSENRVPDDEFKRLPEQDRLLAGWRKARSSQDPAHVHDGATCESRLDELLRAEFANGVRPTSIIDRNRIRKLYGQRFGENLPENFDFVTTLGRVGFAHDGKVFPRPASGDGGWKGLVESLVRQGHEIFQFSRFMELHADELMRRGIVSAEMLHEAIRNEAGDLYDVTKDFFAPKAASPLKARIVAAVVQGSVVVDAKDATKRLPYVDESSIRSLCANADALVWNGRDSYAVLDRILFDTDEIARGMRTCESSVARDGFFSLVQMNLNDSEALNDSRLSGRALRHAFFLRFLSGRMDLHGQIVCAKGAKFDAQAPLRSICRGRSAVTLAEARAIAKECRIADYLALKTLHEEMVRVDAERFASPALVEFDIPATDACLGALAGCRKATPFGDVCRYAGLPAVPGYAWNEYLLESYLRRASERFRVLKWGVVSDAPAGVVVPAESVTASHADRQAGKSAASLLAYAATAAGIPAEPDAVGDFLCGSRCVVQRTKPVIEATLAAMCAKERD